MSDQGILTGPEIVREVLAGNIFIEGFDPELLESEDDNPVNPASYDLHLGDKVAVYAEVVGTHGIHGWPIANQQLAELQQNGGRTLTPDPTGVLDSRQQNEVYEFTMRPDLGWELQPGIGYLMHTKEAVHTDKYVPIIEGKSSIGRLFVTIHDTAGFGDPGFDGEYTLEVSCTHRVILYPGMRICQIRFNTKVGKHLGYNGNYTGMSARGPVPSRSWRQFKKPAG